ncbi:Aste57867_1285 [Aphanomyces stellatus]|uniref:Aste57867_1285 protein n=1 Tax=Aphanomyces stellatus TaxID=120398 RepID=A0A485K633_9STRA|nr:hypothetical protein As57867_001284 [Aphanomyces stellatus]VFT78504.1 Aste57867_1285 [Aphanomyces stellatus]
MPVSDCMEPFAKRLIALFDFGKIHNDILEDEWLTWFNSASEEDPQNLDVLRKRLQDELLYVLEQDHQEWVLYQEGKMVVELMKQLQRNKPLKSDVFRFVRWLRVHTAGFQFVVGLEDDSKPSNPAAPAAPPKPKDLQHRLCVIAHQGAAGHGRIAATTKSVADKFMWKTLKQDVDTFVRTCLHCMCVDGEMTPRPFGEALHAEKPNELLHFDWLSMPKANNGMKHVLVVSDGGSHFKNEVIEDVRTMVGLQHHITTAYSPWANGTVEVVNRMVLRTVKTLLITDFVMEAQQLVPPYAVSNHHACGMKMYHEGGCAVTEDINAQAREVRKIDDHYEVLVKWMGLEDAESSWVPLAEEKESKVKNRSLSILLCLAQISMIWPNAAPLVVAMCCYLYMPLVLYLYVRHSHHPLIKYRQPHLIALSGGFLILFCWGTSIVHLANTSAIVGIVVGFIAPILAMTTLLLSAMVVALHHKITELLVAPSEFPRNLIPTVTRYRWLSSHFAARRRRGYVLEYCQHDDCYAPTDSTIQSMRSSRALYHMIRTLGLTMIFFAEFLVAAGLAIVLAKQLSPIVDTFHLRKAYQRSFVYAGMFVVVGISLFLPAQLLHFDTFGADYYCRHILNTLAAQSILYFHVIQPVVHVLNATSIVRIASLATAMPDAGTELQAFLQERDHYEACLAFCLTECTIEHATEELLAWRCIETFRTMRETPQTVDGIGPNGAMVAAEQVMAMCFGPGAPLVSPTVTPHFEHIYLTRWAAWQTKETRTKDPPPAEFFDEYQRAIVDHLTGDVLPRFQAQSQSWSNFLVRTRSVQGLARVQQLATVSLPPPRPFHEDDVHSYDSSTLGMSGEPLDLTSMIPSSQPNDLVNDDINKRRPATWVPSTSEF